MKALLKIEWIKTWRSWPVFIMSIGMPVGFFLLYSGMEMSPDPASQKDFILSYMLTMTGFSMSSFGFFTFPYMLREDQTDHWLTYIEHSKISIQSYYLSKIFRVLMNSSYPLACSLPKLSLNKSWLSSEISSFLVLLLSVVLGCQ